MQWCRWTRELVHLPLNVSKCRGLLLRRSNARRQPTLVKFWRRWFQPILWSHQSFSLAILRMPSEMPLRLPRKGETTLEALGQIFSDGVPRTSNIRFN